eukprot:6279017-Lingulodinium_polyedra.AAC.1
MQYRCVPASATAPLHAYLALGRKLGPGLCLCYRQIGPQRVMAQHAARNCFWDLGADTLNSLTLTL